MNKQKWALLIVSLVLMAGTAGLLAQLRTHQKLGLPGVKTHPLPGSQRLQVDLPEHVLNYESKLVETDEATLNTLPQDTSFGQRLYQGPDGFTVAMNAVLMGTDRTSLHKPQFCLEGQGWHINQEASAETTVPIERPYSYDLPVIKLITTKEGVVDGRRVVARGVYVYWFVADGALSGSITGIERMGRMATTLLRTGVLQRWAYISCFAVCAPGQEDATFERMKKLVAAAVPEFQLTPRPREAGAPTQPIRNHE